MICFEIISAGLSFHRTFSAQTRAHRNTRTYGYILRTHAHLSLSLSPRSCGRSLPHWNDPQQQCAGARRSGTVELSRNYGVLFPCTLDVQCGMLLRPLNWESAVILALDRSKHRPWQTVRETLQLREKRNITQHNASAAYIMKHCERSCLWW